MTTLILQALYFMLPAYVANAIPNFLPHFKMGKVLDSPVDLGRSFKGKRIFGDNKTVKGFVFGILFAILTCLLQFALYKNGYLLSITVVNYNFIGAFVIGFLLGFGALAGDAMKSFVKRRIDIEPGKPFPVFDQIDFAIGALVFVLLAVALPLDVLLTALIISPILPFVANILAYLLGIKKVWW